METKKISHPKSTFESMIFAFSRFSVGYGYVIVPYSPRNLQQDPLNGQEKAEYLIASLQLT